MSRRAGLYLRISRDRNKDYLAVDRQREDGRQLVAHRGWELVDEWVDNDITATGRKRRPGFEGLLAAVEQDLIDAIVVSEMPRLSRNRRDDLRIMEICQPRQVVIAVVRGSDIDMSTAAGRLTADILAAAARHEIEQKSERQRRQIEQAVKAGRPGAGRRPFGFTDNGVTHHPVEAPLVVELFDRWLAGAGLRELAAWLNDHAVTTPRGNRWRSNTVKFVLRNPRYAGIRGVRELTDEARGTRSEWYTERSPGDWKPIVTEVTWRAALARLRLGIRPDLVRRTGPTPRHLLTQVATCVDCGRHMHSSYTGKGSYYKRAYICSSGGHVCRLAEPIELYVERTLVHRLRRPDAIDLLHPPAVQVDLDAVRTELTAVGYQLRQLGADYADGLLERETLLQSTERLRARRTELEGQLAAAGRSDALSPLVLAPDVDETWRVWRELPLSIRRALLRRTMTVVIKHGRVGRPRAGEGFDPTTVEIEWVPQDS